MVRVINGMRYNTKTAEEIECWNNGYYSSDFNHCNETLFRTKNGNYFVYGEGGALSKWSESVGNNGRGGSSGIIAFTNQDVLEWFEERELDIPETCPEVMILVKDA